jgi:exopolysaccharide production protein ExoY
MGAKTTYSTIPFLDFSEYPIHHNFLKRLFDLGFSLFVLFLTLPLLLLISLLIVATSKGPIFYVQKRATRGGKLFGCLKFRTMYVRADLMLQKMLKDDPAKKKEWDTYFKLKNDPRVTPVGKFLRKTSLDELPQFINVLKGDLSVVGPRPVVVEEIVKYFGKKAPKILSVRPGITGVWQVSGRNNISMEERVLIEESYVESRSFWKDILLILKTIPAVFFSKGAY